MSARKIIAEFLYKQKVRRRKNIFTYQKSTRIDILMKTELVEKVCRRDQFLRITLERPFGLNLRKIHQCKTISDCDKFQYLLQAVVTNSRAANVLESFLAITVNYHQEIHQTQK